jgi:thiopurine S-methyltransferase
MDPDFWLARWREGRTAFHESAPNTLLAKYADRLGAPPKRVFVPLCGKSLDLAHLASLGHEVVGVEVSPIAADAFFENLTPTRAQVGPFEAVTAGSVTILVGDAFALTRELLGPVDAVYDRAALVALPPELQEKYADLVLSLLSPGAPILLITFDYDTSKMQGPPFSVNSERVEQLFGGRCLLERFEQRAVEDRPKFVEAGAIETAWLLTVRG